MAKSVYEQILDKYGLTEADLDAPGHQGERETLIAWANQLQKSDITTSQIRENVESMRYQVQIELVNEPEYERVFFGLIKVPNRRHIFLKARMQNYLVLEAFLAKPGKTKKAIQRAIDSLSSNKNTKEI